MTSSSTPARPESARQGSDLSAADPAQAALGLCCELISRKSVTPDDGGCQDLIAGRLARLGFHVERMRFGAVDNLWARRGSGSPLVCFVGHTDVVPPGPLEQWRFAPFVPTVDGGVLYGRGAADMKSSIAAFVVAVEQLSADGTTSRGSIAMLITSDEEGDAVDGTARTVEWLKSTGTSIDYCLVGEPTCEVQLGDTIRNGRRGSLSGTLRVRGVQGHVAYPHLARNPVLLAAPALAELAAVEWDQGDDCFPATTWQVSNVRAGNGATNVIPGEMEIQFNFRFSTASTPESLQERFHAVLDRHSFEYSVEWVLSARPYLTRRGDLIDAISQAIDESLGMQPAVSTAGGTSDGRFVAEICPQVVEFGPINTTIHKIDERIDISAIRSLQDVYLRTLRKLLAA